MAKLESYSFRLKIQLNEIRNMQLHELDKLTKDNIQLKATIKQFENKLKLEKTTHKRFVD